MLLSEVFDEGQTDQLLFGMRENPVGPPENYSMHKIGGLNVLLIQHDGIARVRLVHHEILYDIFGPAITPETGLAIATELIEQLG